MPELLTVIDCVVAPLDQRYALPALAVKVTDPPAQKIVGPLAVMRASAKPSVPVPWMLWISAWERARL